MAIDGYVVVRRQRRTCDDTVRQKNDKRLGTGRVSVELGTLLGFFSLHVVGLIDLFACTHSNKQKAR